MIFQTDSFYIERHESSVPWLKIFTRQPYKELSFVPQETRRELFGALDICEKTLITYYQPTKINIASFGNVLPRLHLHIMARFEDDSHFPESMWGEKQREFTRPLPPFEPFAAQLTHALIERFKAF